MSFKEKSDIEIQDEIISLARTAEKWAAVTWPCQPDCDCVFCALRLRLDLMDARRNCYKRMGQLSSELQSILCQAGFGRRQMQAFVDRVAKRNGLKRWCNVGSVEDYRALISAVKLSLNSKAPQ